ncbi:ribosome assembly protein 4 [Sporothrix brasiliensis 5110]|uniref:Ribosome assembly protein 4 n=1 Tax=Sporothrix brasiliensis 5110 TaxID=1398154 RepID=A0A0C2FLI5_9PEZI|nr:ribosome assembly protein 4 [Sporothrix brasiliensis 5110]KIH91948.1 ribosome assembly protein 4 [Sporothrix brasiliensis 5110]
MATLVPPPPKRQRREEIARTKVQQDVNALLPPDHGSFKARFIDADGQQMADVVEVPIADASEKNVSLLLNTLLGRDQDEFLPYRFRIHIPTDATDAKDDKKTPLVVDQYPTDLYALLRSHGIDNPFETTLTLAAEPQAVFRVQSVTRLAHRIPGHGQSILAVAFSPAASRLLATGSGDHTARIWDTETGTPKFTLKKHRGWVLAVAWSPDGTRLATCSMDGSVIVWDPETGLVVGKELTGHSKPVLALAWEPYHAMQDGVLQLASASKDGTVRVWAANSGTVQHVLSGHKGSVSCVKWGGAGYIYSASHDKTVRVWDAARGTLVHELKAHAHWVNHLALSTDFVLRTGYFDHLTGGGGAAGAEGIPTTDEAKREKARARYEKAAGAHGTKGERLVSASDDFTMYLWDPSKTKPVTRMVGHQKAINHVTFSPDGLFVASSSWDNHTKIWRAHDGSFSSTLRGHVAPVYQCSWSADSRLLVTASKDATVKVWNVRAAKLAADLPHHEDEVYAVEWSPDGQRVASGSKDKAVRLWRN